MYRRWTFLCVWFCLGALVAADEGTSSDPIDFASQVNFANQVRPILADACFACHGPDEESREADLRLDDADEAMAAIEPGDAASSELYVRLIESDADLLMPPPDSGKKLKESEIAVLKRWIDQGGQVRKTLGVQIADAARYSFDQ